MNSDYEPPRPRCRIRIPRIPLGPRAELERAFERALPLECCGFLLGESRDGLYAIVRRAVATVNATTIEGEFVIPDDDVFRVRLLAAEWKLTILALFHSHPSGVRALSSADRLAVDSSEWPWAVVTRNSNTRELVVSWYGKAGSRGDRRG